jgi:hypothetical protein
MAAIDPTPEEQDAYRTLFDEIHAPVFFEKLAEHGIEPQSETEMAALLDMGAKLMLSQRAAQVKQAQAQGSFVLQAHESLNVALAERGLAPPPVAASDGVIKQAAARVASEGRFQQAALAYQDFLARQQAG